MPWKKLKQVYIALTTGVTLGWLLSTFIFQYYVVIFYSGIADAYANLIADKFVCRSKNIYLTLHDVINNNATTFYLILDSKHVRGYFNGTFYEVTAPDYTFYRNNVTILECTLEYSDSDVFPFCLVVYTRGIMLKNSAKEILEALDNTTS